MRRPTISPTGVILEILLAVGLLASWTISFLSANNAVTGVPPGTRRLILGLWFTSDPLWPAMALAVTAIAAMIVRHWLPVPALVVAAVVVASATWFYPLVMFSEFSWKFILGVTGFWAMWKTKWFIPAALVVLAASAFGSVRVFSINARLEAQGAPGLLQSNLDSFNNLGTALTFAAVSIAAATLVRRFDRQRLALAETNEELRLQRAGAERAAVLDERVRISRELHDVVAHHVTTMTVHAGAARQVAASNPDGAQEALRQIEHSGREAITELHRLLGFLRSGDDNDPTIDDRAPAPSLRHLSHLTDSVVGLACEATITGDLSQIPQSVDVSAYRVVQEALTNAMKHSTNARHVDVTVDAGPKAVHLRIADDGLGGESSSSTVGGHGLVGMQERVVLHEGELTVGQTASGWVVEAELSYAGSGLPNVHETREQKR